MALSNMTEENVHWDIKQRNEKILECCHFPQQVFVLLTYFVLLNDCLGNVADTILSLYDLFMGKPGLIRLEIQVLL